MAVADMGRPPKPPEERATERVEFTCREDQKAAYQAAADAKGIKLAAWIKTVLDRASARQNSR